jgi:hypothetical protein
MVERPNRISVSVKVTHRPVELFKALSRGVGRGGATNSTEGLPHLRSNSTGGAGLSEIAGRNVASRSMSVN